VRIKVGKDGMSKKKIKKCANTCPIRNPTHPTAVLTYSMYRLGDQTLFGDGDQGRGRRGEG